jgi:tetratricopeptide (TPR) repeat protein
MTSSQADDRSVEELEIALRFNPTDSETEYALAQALFDKFAYEGGGPETLDRMREIVARAPADRLRYERAFVALLNEDDQLALQQITGFGTDVSTRDRAPLDVEELWDWIDPMLDIAPAEFYTAFADGLAVGWPDSPPVLTLKGLGENDAATRLKYFQAALEKDDGFWVADYGAGDAWFELKEWTKAKDSYLRALRSETATYIPEIHFALGFCYGHQKQSQAEAEAYRKCLELDPSYPDARNNLGWSLLKAGLYEEAIPVFKDSIEGGNDGKRPLRNLAEALKRLERYDEAIAILQQDTIKGRVTSYSRHKIEEIQALQSGSAKGIPSQPNPTGVTVQVNTTELDAYRERFLSAMPDFADFSLKFGRYWDEERAYKEEISMLTRELLPPAIFEADDKTRAEAVSDAVNRVLTNKLQTIDRPQNLVGWRHIDAFHRYGESEKMIFAAELAALLYGDGDVAERIDAFNTTMWPLLKKGERSNPFARSRLIPTFFLMMIDPAHNISVRTDLFKAVSGDLLGQSLLRNDVFTGAEYRAVLDLSTTVRDHLERWGWCPLDMIDVHSFLWTAAWEYEEEAEGEKAEETTNGGY